MHVELSFYFIFCAMTSIFYPHGILTTMLLSILLIIQQYLYCVLLMDPPRKEPSTYCTECKIMSTNSYVHCNYCKQCFPVTHIHWDVVKRCVSREDMRRYRFIVMLQLLLNLFLSLIQGLLYPPFLIVFFMTIFSCKSIMIKLQVDI